MSISRIEPMQV